MNDDTTYSPMFSRRELVLVNNALNEICNGVRIDDAELATCLGGSREELREVLQEVKVALRQRRE